MNELHSSRKAIIHLRNWYKTFAEINLCIETMESANHTEKHIHTKVYTRLC